ncbi:hypothetical protein LRC484719_49650 [Mycobacterium riyadhense]
MPSDPPGVDGTVAPGLLSPEFEHPASVGLKAINADTANASVVKLRRTAHQVSEAPAVPHDAV